MAEQTIAMVAPDGSVADVPASVVSEALKRGAQQAISMRAPDGSEAWVPLNRVGNAIQAGAIPHSAQDVAAASISRPAAPAGLQGPPDQQGDPVVRDVTSLAKNALRTAYQVSTPGIAAAFAQKYRPGITKGLPAALQPTPLQDSPDGPYGRNALANQIAVNALPMMVGADELPRSSTQPTPKPAGAPAVTDVLADAATGAAKRYAMREIPGVGRVVRAYDFVKDFSDALKGNQPPKPDVPGVPGQLPSWNDFTKQNMAAEMKATGSHGAAMKSLSDKYAALKAGQPAQVPSTNVVGPPELWGKTIPQQAEAPKPGIADAGPSTVPRTLSGEGVLNEALTGLDNKTLLRVARSRGIDVTKEAQLKPGIADVRVVRKIIDDFSPQELENARSVGLEMSRFPGTHSFATTALAREAWHNKVLQTFFPEVNVPSASLSRVAAGRNTAAAPAFTKALMNRGKQ